MPNFAEIRKIIWQAVASFEYFRGLAFQNTSFATVIGKNGQFDVFVFVDIFIVLETISLV